MKTYFNIFKTKSQAYFATNIMFVAFIAANLLNATMLRFLTVGKILAIKPILADTAILLIIGAFAYVIKPKKQYIYFLVWTIFLTIICVANSMYYTYYMSFASVSLLSTSVFIVDVGDAVVEQVLNIKDFVYAYAPILLILLHIRLTRHDYYAMVTKIGRAKKTAVMTLMVASIMMAVFFLSLTSIEISRLYKQWNREYIATNFGIYTYQANDVFQSMEPKISGLFGYDKAVKTFRDYYIANTNLDKANKYTGIFEGRNVIVIHAESIQQKAMDLSFNGAEVTPNLNKLAKEGNYFDNFYSQVSVGTSSDAEFTFNTSLMPVSSGTVFISYADREFKTTVNLLKDKGYYTYCMHGNNAGFWNRNIMYKQIGYDDFISKEDYVIDDTIGLGISDESFFKQSVAKMVEKKSTLAPGQPFYSTLITLTNHTPWSETDRYGNYPVTMTANVNGQEIVVPYMEGTTLGNYYKSTHYADNAIGMFVEELDKAGLLENTVLLIYGDHDARISAKDYDRLNNYDPATDSVLMPEMEGYKVYDEYDYELDRSVPFIIWTKDKKFNVKEKTVMGMYDVLPTIGNMLGISSQYELGHDIFSVTDNVVVFPNGNFLTNTVYYNNQKEEYKALSNTPISQEYIDQNIAHANSILTVSNSIIKFDLVKKQRLFDILKESSNDEKTTN